MAHRVAHGLANGPGPRFCPHPILRYVVDGFGSFWLVLLVVVDAFGWFWVVLAGSMF